MEVPRKSNEKPTRERRRVKAIAATIARQHDADSSFEKDERFALVLGIQLAVEEGRRVQVDGDDGEQHADGDTERCRGQRQEPLPVVEPLDPVGDLRVGHVRRGRRPGASVSWPGRDRGGSSVGPRSRRRWSSHRRCPCRSRRSRARPRRHRCRCRCPCPRRHRCPCPQPWVGWARRAGLVRCAPMTARAPGGWVQVDAAGWAVPPGCAARSSVWAGRRRGRRSRRRSPVLAQSAHQDIEGRGAAPLGGDGLGPAHASEPASGRISTSRVPRLS